MIFLSRKNGELEFIEVNSVAGRSANQAYDREKRARNRSRLQKKRCRQRRRKRLICAAGLVLLVILLLSFAPVLERIFSDSGRDIEEFLATQAPKEEYPQELIELVEKNEETLDFVRSYPDRADYIGQPIDLSGDYVSGEVPLLFQWDKRWGYDTYGNGMIALEGCGPTCLSMVYLYFTGDTTMNPREMAKFASENGYYSPEGTSWSLWTEGVGRLGLSGELLSLSESSMKHALDAGSLIICSMRPGDFTTSGHFILIRGYDEKGFFVNDPNRRSNSEKQWGFERLSGQIKNLWSIHGMGTTW